MPNGVDPVWMETVRIEIDRGRLRPQSGTHAGEEVANNGGRIGRGKDSTPADFSIIVWNRVQGRGQPRTEKVEHHTNTAIVIVILVSHGSALCG